MKIRILSILALGLLITGCMGAREHQQAVSNQDSDRISVGTVQREIRTGMPSSQVIEALGAPNIVTTDEKRREVWVYDKISTEQVYSRSTDSGNILVLGGVIGAIAGVGGAGGAGTERAAGASSTTQRTLTIIIKFDENHLVRDFAYRQSSF